MKPYLAADHRGWELKNKLKDWLAAEGHQVTDLGAAEYIENDDYPDYAAALAKAVIGEPEARGIAVCGSGVGVAVAANKIPGIRAALIHDPQIAVAARQDDDINVLALGADFLTLDAVQEVIQAWLTTPFSGEERHRRRIDKIKRLESSESSIN
jgi:ribose 5-phosphate isomerase B